MNGRRSGDAPGKRRKRGSGGSSDLKKFIIALLFTYIFITINDLEPESERKKKLVRCERCGVSGNILFQN